MPIKPFPALVLSLLLAGFAAAQTDNPSTGDDPRTSDKPAEKDPLEKINRSLGNLRKLPEGNVWIELKNKMVVIDGQICMRKGPLEMFACPPNTKEHESIVQAQAKPFIVHTALLMVGAESGKPVEWEPKYQPASGTRVEVTVHWLDEKGKHRKMRAQDMIRNVRTGKAMTEQWVFAGSEFYTNPNTKVRHYMADGGEMICVSNFTTAMMDLPVESTQSKEGLLFEAFTEKIPEIKTPVRLVLQPQIDKNKSAPGKLKQPEKKEGQKNSEPSPNGSAPKNKTQKQPQSKIG
ncbi:MAG: YdjY domain-containing protein [Planctomycetota bacterium]|nr:YdjY domain-containing protein [Planctomycetota bacterium]